MKVYQRIGLIAAVVCSMAAFNARASIWGGSGGDPFVLNFDENGWGQISINGGSFVDHPGGLSLDPTRSGLYSLTYTLPSTVYAGDIRIWEDSSMTGLSDVIRFTDANGDLTGFVADRMIYYSEAGDYDLADINDIPLSLMPNDSGGIVEQGTLEVYDYFQWAPGGTGDNIYNGISDVPEPVTYSLLALGGLVLAVYRRRSK